MTAYTQSPELAALADQVIGENDNLSHLPETGCRIAYQTADTSKKRGAKTVYADTEKVKDKYRGLLPYDFVITFYWPSCKDLSEEELKRLMFHELCHVGYGKEGERRILPHDVEDFRDCIERWGVDWIQGGKA